jgi:hypothetical protein
LKQGLLFVATLAFCTSSFAGTISLVSSAAGLSANDSVDWGQLGSELSVVPNSFSASSVGGDSITGSFSTTTGLVAIVGSSWGPASGDFLGADNLIWAFDSTANDGTGPITINFPSGFGVGAAIQPDSTGAFVARLELFDGNTSLGFVTENSDSGGDALFIGAVDTAPEVTSAVFSLTSVGSNPNEESNNLGDFAVDTLYLQNAVASSPEPASMLLVGSGLLAVGLMRRRSQKQS